MSYFFPISASCPTGGTYQNETCVCDNSTYTLDAIGQCQPPCAIDTFGVGGMCTNCPICKLFPWFPDLVLNHYISLTNDQHVFHLSSFYFSQRIPQRDLLVG